MKRIFRYAAACIAGLLGIISLMAGIAMLCGFSGMIGGPDGPTVFIVASSAGGGVITVLFGALCLLAAVLIFRGRRRRGAN